MLSGSLGVSDLIPILKAINIFWKHITLLLHGMLSMYFYKGRTKPFFRDRHKSEQTDAQEDTATDAGIEDREQKKWDRDFKSGFTLG